MPRLVPALVAIACCALTPNLSVPASHVAAPALPVLEPGRAALVADQAAAPRVARDQSRPAQPPSDWAMLVCGVAIAAVIARRRTAASQDPDTVPPPEPHGPAARFSLRSGPVRVASVNA